MKKIFSLILSTLLISFLNFQTIQAADNENYSQAKVLKNSSDLSIKIGNENYVFLAPNENNANQGKSSNILNTLLSFHIFVENLKLLIMKNIFLIKKKNLMRL